MEAGEERRRIRFTVADTGPGVPEHKRTTIFEEFEQASVVHAGTGLGLPLCTALVHEMGSSISLECPPSGGSIFSFELSLPPAPPICAAAPPCATSLREDAPPASDDDAPLPSGLRVLIADDMPLNCKLLAFKLGKLLPQPECTMAHSGEEALEKLRRDPPYDVMILDNLFGNDAGLLTGLDVTKQVRKADIRAACGAALPIIGASGNEGGAHNEAAFAAGQCAVWGKPLPADKAILQDFRRLLHAGAREQRGGHSG